MPKCGKDALRGKTHRVHRNPSMRRFPSFRNMNAPHSSSRHSTSFSVISSSEFSELEWFDDEGCRSIAVESIDERTGHALHNDATPDLIEYYESRLLEMQKEIYHLKKRLALVEGESNPSVGVIDSLTALFQDICIVGIFFQFECTNHFLAV